MIEQLLKPEVTYVVCGDRGYRLTMSDIHYDVDSLDRIPRRLMRLATRTVTILVTDCRDAAYGSNIDCPLARGLRRVLRSDVGVRVSGFGHYRLLIGDTTVWRDQIPRFGFAVVNDSTIDFSREVTIPEALCVS